MQKTKSNMYSDTHNHQLPNQTVAGLSDMKCWWCVESFFGYLNIRKKIQIQATSRPKKGMSIVGTR